MPDVLYEKHPEGQYALFTFNRPERLNALGGTLMAELVEAVEDFTADPQMRVGIVTGAGRAFCAGADMREGVERQAATDALQSRLERGEITQAQFEEESNRLAGPRVPLRWTLFSTNPKPFIAAINGAAIGGGMHLAMDCDIRIASTEGYLGLFEPIRGLAAGYGSQYLGRMIPHGEAMYIILTCDKVVAEEARRVGLVHEVLEPGRLLPRAAEIATKIAENAPLAIEATKAVAQFSLRHAGGEFDRYSQPLTRRASESEDVWEGRRAFVEKRPPRWHGR